MAIIAGSYKNLAYEGFAVVFVVDDRWGVKKKVEILNFPPVLQFLWKFLKNHKKTFLQKSENFFNKNFSKNSED